MNIGFDAKRIFYNTTGLGNYSRETVGILSEYYPDNKYYLYTPNFPGKVPFPLPPSTIIRKPVNLLDKTLKSYWRSVNIVNQIKQDHPDIYHGLSNELPANIRKAGCKSIVTIHDLIFLRYPELYKPLDRKIYEIKSRKSCSVADKIIAISQQTKIDIIDFLKIDPSRIEVVYQSISPIYFHKVTQENKLNIKEKYNLPETYLLNVGTIQPRKNQLSLIKAIEKSNIDIPIVFVGRSTPYISEIKNYLSRKKISNNFIFLHHVPTTELPAIYQMAHLFVYPALFEGFGLPVVEALASGIPVITSKEGCFPEAGGSSTVYINPKDETEIGHMISKVLADSELRNKMVTDGLEYAKNFCGEKVAGNLMDSYMEVVAR